MPKSCKSFHIQGVVQGVFYRANTVNKAKSMGLVGKVWNEADGSVRAVACGDDEAIERLAAWFWEGPPAAQVSVVTSEMAETQDFDDFTMS